MLSIKHCGLLQPIMVTQRGEEFVVIFGNHRLEACKRLGWDEIPAIVEQSNEQETFLLQVVENLQRNLKINPVEEAKGYEMLMRKGMTIQEIASDIGKSYQYVWSKLRMRERLHPKILQGIEDGRFRRLTTSHAEQLSMLRDTGRQLQLAEAIEDHNISVSRLEKILYQEIVNNDTPKTADGTLHVFRKGNAIYEQYKGECRITLMSDVTFNMLAKWLGRKARRAGREMGRMRRRAALQDCDQTVPRLEFLTRIFNDTFGWGKLSITESQVILDNSILDEAAFLTGYLEGYLGLPLQLVRSLDPMVFRISNGSPHGEKMPLLSASPGAIG